MSFLRKHRLRLETFLTRLGLVLLPRLPRSCILRLARLAGFLAFLLARGQRRIALANLEIAFVSRFDARTRRKIARRAFFNMALVVLDLFWFSRNRAGRVARYVRLDSDFQKSFGGRNVVGVTAHFGNWELLSHALALNGFSHVAVAAPLANPEVDVMIGAGRSVAGVEIIYQRGAVRKLLRALRAGRHVALLLDQNTKPEDGGVFVDFFGLPIPMSSAAAVLAERTGKPIAPVFCAGDDSGHYTIYARPMLETTPAAASAADAVQAATQNIAAVFEREISAAPGQWLWMYKRWKYVCPDLPRSAYPFYAKPLR